MYVIGKNLNYPAALEFGLKIKKRLHIFMPKVLQPEN